MWPIPVERSTRSVNLIKDLHIAKSNQITFIVTSPQHKCLGEWNSYERAPDSAKKQQQQFTYGQTVQKKQQTIYIWTDSAKKTTTIYIWTDSAKKQQTIYIWTDSAKKQQQFTYGQTVQKNNNNLHMDRQCKKNNKQFTYGQTVQKNNNNLHMDRQCKKKQQTIYIWTDSAKKQNKQFTYGQTVQKSCTGAFTVLQTVQKNNNNLHMDSTYLQTVQTMCKIHIHILSTHSVL